MFDAGSIGAEAREAKTVAPVAGSSTRTETSAPSPLLGSRARSSAAMRASAPAADVVRATATGPRDSAPAAVAAGTPAARARVATSTGARSAGTNRAGTSRERDDGVMVGQSAPPVHRAPRRTVGHDGRTPHPARRTA